ncbi:FliA/WhiG family RNA polymerase sigma factor [soil metagenome]
MSVIEKHESELIEQNLNLVGQVVIQVAVHFPRFVDRQELARAGALGLVEAARRYDSSRGVPFERFAARRIRGAILDSVRSADWVPRSVRTVARQLEQTEQLLAGELGRPPTTANLAEALGMTTAEVHRLRAKVFRSVVLALEHLVAGSDEEFPLVEVLADRTAVEPAEELESRELLGYLRDAVTLLPERHRRVIVGYFLDGRTSAELASELVVTESRISQLRSEGLDMLRQGIGAQYSPPQPEPGRIGHRRAAYATAIGSASDWKSRLDVRLATAV